MKKIFNLAIMALMLAAISFFAVSCSDDDTNTTEPTPAPENTLRFAELPGAAQLFVQNHFEEESVDAILRSTTEEGEGYNVSVSGYKIDFGKDGLWRKIEAKDNGALSADIVALIPTSISGYIEQNYAGKGINEIKKKDYGYQVELAGKPEVELEFNFDGTIIKIDEDDDDEDDDETVSLQSLPEVCQAFVATHFASSTVKEVKKDKDSYEVKFADKTEIEFYASGEWKKVETDNNAPLPQSVIALLPEKAVSHIASEYAGKTVNEIENKQGIYEAKLYPGISLTFDKDGNIWGVSGNNDSGNNQSKTSFDNLPQPVKDFVGTHFPGIGVLYVNKTNKEYKVGLVDGSRLDFTFDNQVQAIVSVRGQGIPSGAVQPAIANYIGKNYPNQKMKVYIKQYQGYIVELSGYPVNKVFFDLSGNFLRAY